MYLLIVHSSNCWYELSLIFGVSRGNIKQHISRILFNQFCCHSCNRMMTTCSIRIKYTYLMSILLNILCKMFNNLSCQHDLQTLLNMMGGCQTHSISPPTTLIVMHQQVQGAGNNVFQDSICHLLKESINTIHTNFDSAFESPSLYNEK